MALSTFDQNFYLANNPDVLSAVVSGAFESAEQHYMMFGEREGRKPNQFFDPTGYLANNADVLAAVQAGLISTGLEHFELFGVNENRTPGNLPFDEDFYLANNQDVADAVAAGTFTSGFEHYVKFGAAEGRQPAEDVPAGITGEAFNLTPEPFESVTGTPQDDLINGVMSENVLGDFTGTFNTGDSVNGAGGTDTFNLFLEAGIAPIWTPPAGSAVSATEVINLISNGANTFTTDGANVEATFFDGATQVWQVNGSNPVTNLGAGVTAGFRDGGTSNVTAANGADSAAIALDNVTPAQTVAVNEAAADDVQTVSLSGTIEETPGPGVSPFTLNLGGLSDVQTVNVALSSEADLGASNYSTATTLDASASTGAVTLNTGGTVETVLGGSAGDDITTGAATQSVTGNAGADDVLLTGGTAEEIAIAEGDTGITATTVDDYNGFVSGEDSFNFGLDAGDDAVNFEDGGLSSSFTDGLTNANTAFASTDGLLYFLTNDGGDGFLFVDRDADGSADEGLILTGVTTINDTDIVA
ncbi:hypothetical protein CKO31_16880 [Thiohalocapsa halophila]|uniref:Calcium-binding protein n=1 Tax=Thiohalocapsa halophila TaxID=69359 RepID=A0ABS1CM11_9GAMM|nr:hypothetical protein [Thiohalocapsa halophila]MBK1632381.1 hypothetical protein [Thiohalocapsa halophila]